MLRVEIEMFSGRPNPVWMLTDADAVQKLLRLAAASPKGVSKPGAGFDGLGLREVRIERFADDEAALRGVPKAFAVGSPFAGDPKAARELAKAFIETMPKRSDVKLLQHELTPLSSKLHDLALERLDRLFRDPPRPPQPPPKPPSNPLRTTIPDEKCGQCQYEVSQYNPGFWNNPATQPYNNCYNYARNWRTNTFAQPGRAHGAQTSTMACGTVTTAAMADGLKKRCDCLSEKEWPRRLMALVIDPGWDYHWYRHQRGGFWGHKPGSTAARNTDNSGVLIVNPETCNRGGYTDFCGYFYAGKSVVIN
ncbi:hypothetical protein CFHF_21870 [Caulobacter flavus]|uniref:Uncharacterized protein n=1 Tax=Caulobacter flavus TaxID=1679497 RepID=A0A2N5CN56_9CAUL|nr:hypothetical protein [Caulobacter flavus]AYV46640.1 hypothetical protein C1707_10395 [Caulobacter flavus]PLR07876.1 hypothetical protein CFHF_21870 [Caulobacter flavus]